MMRIRKSQTGGFRHGRTPRLFLVLGLWVAGASLVRPGPCQGQTAATGDRGVHYRWSQETPPGVIGSWQLLRGVGPAGYTQPVRVTGPAGLVVNFGTGAVPAPTSVSLTVGQVHRFQMTGLPDAPGEELWPTIEIIDRLHPPVGSEEQFPILVALEPEEIEMARLGALVTKVIYLEEPDKALPYDGSGDRLSVYDVGPNRNPIQVADLFGRPVAIVRVGSWAPTVPAGQAAPMVNEADRVSTTFPRGEAVVPVRAAATVPGPAYGVPTSQARDRIYR